MRHHRPDDRADGGPLDPATTTADPREPLPLLRKELGIGDRGLSGREAARRLVVYGPDQVQPREKQSLPRLLSAQLAHPLALLLWGAGALAFVAGMPVLGWAILAVMMVNAVFALPWDVLVIIATFPVIVWAADELHRRRRVRIARRAA